jgi:hypothetical protein
MKHDPDRVSNWKTAGGPSHHWDEMLYSGTNEKMRYGFGFRRQNGRLSNGN